MVEEFWITSIDGAKRGLFTHIVLRNGDLVTAQEFLRLKGEEPEEPKKTKAAPKRKAVKKESSTGKTTKAKTKKSTKK